VRIALFHNLPSGGAKRHTREQARELARRGHEVVEVRPSTADVEFCPLRPYVAEERVFPAPPPAAPARRIPFVTPYLHALQGLAALRGVDRLHRRIAAAIDADGFDVVLAQDCRIAMTPYLMRHLHTGSVFFCHHGFSHWRPVPGLAATWRDAVKARYYAPARFLFARVMSRDERRNAQCAAQVLTASEFGRAEIRAHYGVDAVVVGAGVDGAIFTPTAASKADYVLSVGELRAQKDYPFLIAALGALDARWRPRLVIAANAEQPGEAAAVRRLAATRGVVVEITRAADDAALAALYAGARLFVYAPRSEMLGMACLEAMSCGTPVVAVRDGGVPETVVDSVTGSLTERDPRAFAVALEALLADGARRERMGVAAAAHVRAAWSWQRTGERVEAALAREVGHRR
jgi:glycosyltransferase involved in cell wall biosynthesis